MPTLEANLISLVDQILAKGWTEIQMTNVVTLVRAGLDALRAERGLSGEELAAQVFPLAEYAVVYLQAKAAAQ